MSRQQHRIEKLRNHLTQRAHEDHEGNSETVLTLTQNHTNAQQQGKQGSASSTQHEEEAQQIQSQQEAMDAVLRSMLESLEDRTLVTGDLSKVLPGPLDEVLKKLGASGQLTHADKIDQMMSNTKYFREGHNHIMQEDHCRKYGANGIGSNVVQPITIAPQSQTPYLDWLVTIGDPSDAERIARVHTKKALTYGIAFLGDGVLSTRDNEHWRDQRRHLQDAFLPSASLARIFPVSLKRAQHAINERLPHLTNSFREPVEINEFFLHEAMAQLQLALLGENEEFMEETNIPLRASFTQALHPAKDGVDIYKQVELRKEARKFIQRYSVELVDRSNDPQSGDLRHHEATMDAKCPVSGPVTARLTDLQCPVANRPIEKIRRDNAATFLFAGHDTTANLMTWFTFEMARNPDIEARIQKELDWFFDTQLKDEAGNTREMTYKDLPKLKFMTLCIMETLRLWPSVPNGTMREFQFDDQIVGREGKPVDIPKGTQCMIPVWLLHVNEQLWGPDVEEFNPDRKFLPEEIWSGEGLKGYNPQSYRYCPFTIGPRDCLGKNFAHMEARVILALMFRTYSVSLAEPTLSESAHARDRNHFMGENHGTMGPGNGIYINLHPRNR